jgi:hypothetical protein
MASIGNDPGGRRRILFVAPDGKRKTIRLGVATKRQAEAVKRHVENLATAAITHTSADPATSRWLALTRITRWNTEGFSAGWVITWYSSPHGNIIRDEFSHCKASV